MCACVCEGGIRLARLEAVGADEVRHDALVVAVESCENGFCELSGSSWPNGFRKRCHLGIGQ